jgi:SAM-dependent methyltransferase
MLLTNEILKPENYLLKTRCLLDMVLLHYGGNFSSSLVVGCGSGREAALIAEVFGCKVDGIDLDGSQFLSQQSADVRFMAMDASHLEFESASYDFIYSFHAIEHIRNLDQAMSEMKRVLRPGGVFCIGTPNKSRLVGYVGSSTTLYKKLMWNLADFYMRLTGRWENALGAHAGFRRNELLQLCRSAFGEISDVTDEYYLRLYANKKSIIETLIRLNLADIMFPAVYAMGRRQIRA